MGLSATVQIATAMALPHYVSQSSGTLLQGDENSGALEIDSVGVQLGDTLLVKNEADARHNGIYEVLNRGGSDGRWSLRRRKDLSLPDDAAFGGIVGVISGADNAGSQWFLAASGGAIGSKPLIFSRASERPSTIEVANRPGSEQQAATLQIDGAAVLRGQSRAIVDLGRIDAREYMVSGVDNNEAIEAALMELRYRRGGELYIPEGTHHFTRGIRVPDFIDDEKRRWCAASPHGGLSALVDGPYDDHNFYVVRIVEAGSGGSPAFEWSNDGGLSFKGPVAIPLEPDQDAPAIIELPGTKGMLIRFESPRKLEKGAMCCWIGNGFGPVPPNTRIRGAGIDAIGHQPLRGTTLLRFDFSKSGGMGDAFCFGWATTSNPGYLIKISDLAIENASKSNHLGTSATIVSRDDAPAVSVAQKGDEKAKPPIDEIKAFPFRPDFEIEILVTDVETRNGRKLPVFECRTGYRADTSGPAPAWAKDWFTDRISLHDHVLPESLEYPGEIRAYLPGTGVRAIFPDGEYKVGDSYQWSTVGYAGAGIVSYGGSALTIENVSFYGFARGIALHISNNSIIRSCAFSPNPHSGGSVAQETINAEGCIGIWITNYVNNIRGGSTAPSSDSALQPFHLSGGNANIHLIETCDFGRLAIGIWHEDGVNHIVRQCKFASTITCSELGSVSAVHYEGCYYEGIGHCDEIDRVAKLFKETWGGFLPIKSFRGTVFGMNRGALSSEVASQIAVQNCYVNLSFGTPVFRLLNNTHMSLRFDQNVLSGGRDPEGRHGQTPLVETGPWANLHCLSWSVTVGTPHKVVAQSRGGYSRIEPMSPHLGGLGLGTMLPQANLHVKAWAGTEGASTQTDLFLPLFKFESPASAGNAPSGSYELSSDLRMLSNTVYEVNGSKAGRFIDVRYAVTNAAALNAVQVLSWPMLRRQCASVEVTCIAIWNNGGFAGLWKVRAVALRLGDAILFLGGAAGLNHAVIDHVPSGDGRHVPGPTFAANGSTLECLLNHGAVPEPVNWTVKSEIVQTFNTG